MSVDHARCNALVTDATLVSRRCATPDRRHEMTEDDLRVAVVANVANRRTCSPRCAPISGMRSRWVTAGGLGSDVTDGHNATVSDLAEPIGYAHPGDAGADLVAAGADLQR
ncbi:hypothetical protein [Micromonospora globispora]|uniref:hypothetical protein n=1 Tax=Micromonospora globispora TaxID=1450148 RepID=UPI000F501688|nr:hypothetical protein [Micromonospora globispora]